MSFKKISQKVTRFILGQLPLKLKTLIFRMQVNVPLGLQSDYVFKIAESQEELEASFKLVYQSYFKLGYCGYNKHGLRGTKFHALKSTTTLIAKFQNRVVGTLTIVRDNSIFGLPLEQAFDIKNLRTGGHRIAEITSMVIDPEFRQQNGGKILFPLLKLMHAYATFYFGANKLVIAIRPKDQDFYRSLLMFESIHGDKVQEYLGAPATIMSLDLDKAEEKFYNAYSKKPHAKNLYHFFKEAETPYVWLPQRKVFFVNDILVQYDIFNSLFLKKLNIEDSKLNILFNLHDQSGHSERSPRFEIDAPALFKTEKTLKIQSTMFLDVSKEGFRTKLIENISLDEVVIFTVHFSNETKLIVYGRAIWINPHFGIGFKLLNGDSRWANLVQGLEKNEESTNRNL